MAGGRKTMSPRGQKILGVVFLLIGAGMLCGGTYWGWHTRSFLKSAATAQGVVVEVEMVASRRSKTRRSKTTTYAPIYTFSDAHGVVHKIRSRTRNNSPSYSVGETVTVHYNPNNPDDALLDGWFELWGGMTILGGIGLVFFVLGVVFSGLFTWLRQLHAPGSQPENPYGRVE